MPRHDAVRSAGYLRFRVMPPVDDGHGSYRIVGKLFRVKAWEGDFSYERHPSGWNSEDLHLRTDGWRTSGGFLVSRIDDSTCRVTHYEDYSLPNSLRRWRPLLSWYMRRIQIGEMRDLTVLVEQTLAARKRNSG